MENLVRVTRGVWRPTSLVDDLAGRVAAVLSGCPDGTVVSGVTAARLHGLWLPPAMAAGRRIEVICQPDRLALERRSRSVRPEVRGRRQYLAPDEIVDLEGLPVTSEARTWLDLATALGDVDLLAAGDSALRGTATRTQLAALVARARHRPGVVRARRTLPLLDGRSRSRPESHLRYAVLSNGLPQPGVNEPVHDALGQWLGEPDLSYDDVRLAIEYNGAEHAEVRRMRSDLTREDDLEMRGDWRVVTFGPAQVFGRPDQVAARIRRLRTERRGRRVSPWDR